MIAPLLLFAFFLSGDGPPPASLSTDLDGQGAVESAIAVPRGNKVRLQIRDARGKLLADSPVPAPGESGPRVSITAGSLGSAGALIEVAAAGPGSECRSLWRYRDGRLLQTPVLASAGPLPDCGPREWSYRWERPSEEAPAVYMRERQRHQSNGLLRQVEAFRYAGFRLEADPALFTASINGIEIPHWRDPLLYSRAAVEQLAGRFDLSPFQSLPRLRLVADRVEGAFEVRIEDGPTVQTLPVTAVSFGKEKQEVFLTAGERGIRVRVLLNADRSIPLEAAVEGLGERLDREYAAVKLMRASGLRVYESAEQELAEALLPGTWDDGKNPLVVQLVSSSPVLLRVGKSEASLSVTRAPRGTDVLVVPADGSLPVTGFILRGKDSLVEVPVHCDAGGQRCEAGAGRLLRRVGARLNIR